MHARIRTVAVAAAAVGALTLVVCGTGSAVVKVAAPTKPVDEFMESASGKRFVGVQFRFVNTGEAACSDGPSDGAQVADSEGRQFDATSGDVTVGPSMAPV